MKQMLFNNKNQITNKLTLQPSSSQLAKGEKMNMRINKQYYIRKMNQQWCELNFGTSLMKFSLLSSV